METNCERFVLDQPTPIIDTRKSVKILLEIKELNEYYVDEYIYGHYAFQL